MDTVAFILLFGALVVAALLIVRRINAPRLEYTAFPLYEIPELLLVGGVLVENRGGSAAPNVKLAISYDGAHANMFHHLQVESEEPYILRGGGEQHHFATIRLRQLRPGKKMFVYWAISERVQPSISLTSFQPISANPITRLLGGGDRA